MGVFNDLSLQKAMCLSHPHRKTSFTQQECEITMFQDWSWGGGQFGCQWEEISVHSDDIRQSERPLNSSGNQCSTSAQGAEIKHQVALMADSHTRHKGNINYRRRHVRWRTYSNIFRGAIFKVTAGFRWMSYDHDSILISQLSNN